MEKDILVLAVESSCDEPSVAVIKNGTEILSNVVASQIESHKRFGGVVPEVASRHHVESVTLVFEEALKVANVTWDDIDAITVTEGPGLIGSLLIGINAAKALAFAHDIPLVGVHHCGAYLCESISGTFRVSIVSISRFRWPYGVSLYEGSLSV